VIGFLKGNFLGNDGETLMIDVDGVGYSVVPSASVRGRNLSAGSEVSLYIHTHVRENELKLFGFSTLEERQIFELLLTVSGVGPKTALALVSAGGPQEVRRAIGAADVDHFTTIPGVGKKTAQRIIVDLKSKIGGIGELDLASDASETPELFAALKSMGFRGEEIKEALKKVDRTKKLEDQIKQALKQLS
jgi:Holliday junction DNA helicase RuvA